MGMLVAVTSSDYSFKDGSGEQRAGTSHRAWISPGFNVTPVEVTLPPQSDLPVKMSMYSEPIGIRATVETVARNKGSRAVIEYRLIDFEEVDATKLPARGKAA